VEEAVRDQASRGLLSVSQHGKLAGPFFCMCAWRSRSIRVPGNDSSREARLRLLQTVGPIEAWPGSVFPGRRAWWICYHAWDGNERAAIPGSRHVWDWPCYPAVRQ
jgi:hypothetical protein